MATLVPVQKRALDLVLIGLASGIIIVVSLLCIGLILLVEGRPVFYISTRRVYRDQAIRVAKFRTMRRDAEAIANRRTVPITSTRFLNIPSTSDLYTPVGRMIERLMLTELPQLYYVLCGSMSLVGNRPLPENVIAALREEHSSVEDRFRSPAGLTGPVQLVGRDLISDADRLRLEIAYCHRVADSYSMTLDVRILFLTVLVGTVPRFRMTPEQALALLAPPARDQRWSELFNHASTLCGGARKIFRKRTFIRDES